MICENGGAIPLTFIHPRWWVAGPSITMKGWVPTFAHTQPSIRDAANNPTNETNALAPTLTNYLSLGRLRIVIEDQVTNDIRETL